MIHRSVAVIISLSLRRVPALTSLCHVSKARATKIKSYKSLSDCPLLHSWTTLRVYITKIEDRSRDVRVPKFLIHDKICFFLLLESQHSPRDQDCVVYKPTRLSTLPLFNHTFCLATQNMTRFGQIPCDQIRSRRQPCASCFSKI